MYVRRQRGRRRRGGARARRYFSAMGALLWTAKARTARRGVRRRRLLRGGSTDVRSSVRDAYAATAAGGPGATRHVGDASAGARLRARARGRGGFGTGLRQPAGGPVEGEVVLDLGSGAGVDCLAAETVGRGARHRRRHDADAARARHRVGQGSPRSPSASARSAPARGHSVRRR